MATSRPLATPSRWLSLTSSAIGSVFQTSRPLSASKAKIADGVARGHDDPPLVHHGGIQVAVAALPDAGRVLARIVGDPAHGSRSRPRARSRHRGSSGSRGSGRRARAADGRSRRRPGRRSRIPHRHEVVDLGGGRPEVADPPAIARSRRRSRRRRSPSARRRSVTATYTFCVVGDRRPLEVDRAVAIRRPVGQHEVAGLLLPEQLALGVPVEGDDGAGAGSAGPIHAHARRRECGAPIRA